MAKKKKPMQHYVGLRKRDNELMLYYTRNPEAGHNKIMFHFLHGPFESREEATLRLNQMKAKRDNWDNDLVVKTLDRWLDWLEDKGEGVFIAGTMRWDTDNPKFENIN